MLDLLYKYDSFISVLCQPWKTTRMEEKMDTRPAIIAVIIEDNESVKEFNAILHEYAEYVIGRMGIPYRTKGINIISVAVDAPQDVTSSMAGRIGRLKGVTAKTVYSNI